MKLFIATVAVTVLSGCGYYDNEFQGMNNKLTSMDARIRALEKAPPPVPSTPTILWVQNPMAYPRASAAYSTKDECAAVAQQWTFPGDKGAKVIGYDPWITQSSKKDYLVVSCLPQGVTPFAK